MDIRITYCGAWNYQPTAASLAARLKEAFGVDSTLIRGGGGVFDVEVDGELRYSKFETHTFPDETALVAQLRQGQGAD